MGISFHNVLLNRLPVLKLIKMQVSFHHTKLVKKNVKDIQPCHER